MQWAILNNYAVFTHDLDFGTMLAFRGAAGPSVVQVRCLNARLGAPVEEWPYLDEGTLQKTRSRKVCMTCHWFRHHAGVNCIPVLTCQLHQVLIAHGEHLTSRCQGWTDDMTRPPRKPWASSRLTVPCSQRTCQSAVAASACGRHPPAPPGAAPAASSRARRSGKVPAPAQPPGVPR
jgi:hypothetical protein